ncbi:MAG TPA: NAD-dependent epimerase/dehydratase family protein [Anaerolineae bacterium]
MRVLITGGAGFIGSHLAERALREGWRVAVLDNLSTGRRANLTGLDLDFVEGDICDEPLVRRTMQGCDLVCHLAAAVGVPVILKDVLGALRSNVRGTEVVLETAAEYGIRVCLASSSEVYGRSDRLPFREDDASLLGPTSVARWSYAAAKIVDEHLALAYRAQRDLPVSIVRYFNAYGPRTNLTGYASVIAVMIVQALRGEPITVYGDGSQTRCFTYVTDMVEGTWRAATLDAAIGGVFNLGRPLETRIIDLAQQIKQITGSASPVTGVPYEKIFGAKFQDVPRRVPDVSRATEILGFRASVSLEEGLRRTIDWIRESHDLLESPERTMRQDH